MGWLSKKHSILPGFGITLGYTVLYLSLIVLLPLTTLVVRTYSLTWPEFWQTVTDPRVLASLRLTFGGAFFAAAVNAVFGFVVSWVLVRYEFFGRKFLDSLIDLPFALPTAVSGLALATIYSPTGWLGRYCFAWGIPTAYSSLGVMIAMTFIGLPFVVRTLQPAIEELDVETEEAADSLGASRWQKMCKVTLPALLPAWLTGFTLAFARGLGEYGSVVFISGNKFMETEIAASLILEKLEQYQYAKATAIALTMLVASFVLLFSINLLQWWAGRRLQGGA
ncbi:MAG: sulfate ABC transporter permease subunit CysT [Pirellulales bacterium]|nr:sulfate ABC transporter permease subunit CysT [Pirellulales bacterium]